MCIPVLPGSKKKNVGITLKVLLAKMVQSLGNRVGRVLIKLCSQSLRKPPLAPLTI